MAMPLRDGLPELDHPVILGPVIASPVVASDGSQYFVVWKQFPLGLIGQRLDRQGAPIDAQPFVIDQAPSLFDRPAVSYDGENFVVAYETGSGAGCTHGTSLNESARRVSTGGVVLDQLRIELGGRSCGGTDLSLASAASGSLLAWNGTGGPAAALITRSGATATPLDLSSVLRGSGIRAVWTGTVFIVADVKASSSTGAGSVEWVTLTEGGTPLLRGVTPEPAAGLEVFSSSFARSASGALFVWSGGRPGDHDIVGLQFSRSGQPVGESFPISRTEFDETSVALADRDEGHLQVAYQRTIGFPTLPGLSRIFTREVDIVPPSRRRAARR
jgi:hypothetical protein